MQHNTEFSKNLTYLTDIEALAQDILTLKEDKLELSHVLNKLQESLRALQKSEEKKTFIKMGPLYLQNSTDDCKSILQKEIETIKGQYNTISEELRKNWLKKRDLEFESQIKGIKLKPLSYKESDALTNAFGLQ